jgi:hypothetical protein
MILRVLSIFAILPLAYAQPDVESGFRVGNVTAFSEYYSTSPEALYVSAPIRNAWSAGAGATFTFDRSNERSGMSWSYAPSYIARFRAPKSNTSNHYMAFTGHSRFTPRLTFTYSLTGIVSSTNDYLFRPTRLSKIAAAAGAPGDLSSAMVTGDSSNAQIATALTEAPGAGPLGLVIFGDRLWSASALAGLKYDYSGRLSLYLNVGATRIQYLNSPGARDAASYHVIPHSMMGFVSPALSYLLSPRTRVRLELESNRWRSELQDAYSTGGQVALDRMMTMNWFVNLQGGATTTKVVRSVRAANSGPQATGEALIGHKTRSSAFLISARRSGGDTYGLGYGTSTSAGAAWVWNRAGSPWTVKFTLAHERLSGKGFSAFIANRGEAEFGRQLSRHVAVVLQYAYLQRPGVLHDIGQPRNLHSGRFGFVWDPSGFDRGYAAAVR